MPPCLSRQRCASRSAAVANTCRPCGGVGWRLQSSRGPAVGATGPARSHGAGGPAHVRVGRLRKGPGPRPLRSEARLLSFRAASGAAGCCPPRFSLRARSRPRCSARCTGAERLEPWNSTSPPRTSTLRWGSDRPRGAGPAPFFDPARQPVSAFDVVVGVDPDLHVCPPQEAACRVGPRWRVAAVGPATECMALAAARDDASPAAVIQPRRSLSVLAIHAGFGPRRRPSSSRNFAKAVPFSARRSALVKPSSACAQASRSPKARTLTSAIAGAVRSAAVRRRML